MCISKINYLNITDSSNNIIMLLFVNSSNFRKIFVELFDFICLLQYFDYFHERVFIGLGRTYLRTFLIIYYLYKICITYYIIIYLLFMYIIIIIIIIIFLHAKCICYLYKQNIYVNIADFYLSQAVLI